MMNPGPPGQTSRGSTPEGNSGMAPIAAKKLKNRSYDVDWTRFIAIWCVVGVHIVEGVYRLCGTMEIEDKILARAFQQNLLQIGMPFFFLASGRAQAYGHDSFRVFVWKKAKRLLVPMVFGYFTILALTCYVSKNYRPCFVDIDEPRYQSFFKFYPLFLERFSCTGFEWMWFFPVCFILFLLEFFYFQAFKEIAENILPKVSGRFKEKKKKKKKKKVLCVD
eukprot:Trichotokara_eunicae@DN665_c0_g1_i1.p1